MYAGVDFSVASLVEKIGNAQTRHRFIATRQNQVNSSLALATADNKTLKEKYRVATAAQQQIKNDLDKLTEAHRALQLLWMTESDRFRRCEMEEPLLEKHVDEKIAAITTKLEEWNHKSQDLEKLADKSNDKFTARIKQKIKNLDDSIVELEATKKTLQMNLESATALINKKKEEEESRKGFMLLSLPFPHNTTGSEFIAWNDDDEEDAERLSEIQETLKLEWEQTFTQCLRSLRTVQREAHDLSLRSDQLSGWHNHLRQTRARLEECAKVVGPCIHKRICFSCWLNDPSR